MAAKKNLTKEQVAQLISEYKAGKSVLTLSRDWNLSTPSIYHQLRVNRVKLIQRPRQQVNMHVERPELIQKLRELMKTNKPRVEIAKELNLPVSTLYYYCDKHNINPRVLNGGKKVPVNQRIVKTKGYYYLSEKPTNNTLLPFGSIAFVENDRMYVQISRNPHEPEWRGIEPRQTEQKQKTEETAKKGFFWG